MTEGLSLGQFLSLLISGLGIVIAGAVLHVKMLGLALDKRSGSGPLNGNGFMTEDRASMLRLTVSMEQSVRTMQDIATSLREEILEARVWRREHDDVPECRYPQSKGSPF